MSWPVALAATVTTRPPEATYWTSTPCRGRCTAARQQPEDDDRNGADDHQPAHAGLGVVPRDLAYQGEEPVLDDQRDVVLRWFRWSRRPQTAISPHLSAQPVKRGVGCRLASRLPAQPVRRRVGCRLASRLPAQPVKHGVGCPPPHCTSGAARFGSFSAGRLIASARTAATRAPGTPRTWPRAASSSPPSSRTTTTVSDVAPGSRRSPARPTAVIAATSLSSSTRLVGPCGVTVDAEIEDPPAAAQRPPRRRGQRVRLSRVSRDFAMAKPQRLGRGGLGRNRDLVRVGDDVHQTRPVDAEGPLHRLLQPVRLGHPTAARPIAAATAARSGLSSSVPNSGSPPCSCSSLTMPSRPLSNTTMVTGRR